MSDQKVMKRYLLGSASPEERIALENRYLTNPTALEELAEAENDLIDSYVRSKLSDHDRGQFEKQYLTSPTRRARVQFASALTEISRESHQAAAAHSGSFWQWLTLLFTQPSPQLQWGMGVAGVVVLLTIAWFAVPHDRNLQATLPPRAVERDGRPPMLSGVPEGPNAEAPSSGNTAGTEVAKADRPELAEFTVQLNPGIVRGMGAGTITFAVPKTGVVNLRLTLDDDDHKLYAAVVETAEGSEIQHVDGLKSHESEGNKVVDVRVPSRLIVAGDYIIRLKGTSRANAVPEEVDVYSFRAVSK